MDEQITWMANRALMTVLWPKWKMEPALLSLLDERWGKLHQDKLRECIKQHRLERDTKPDIAAIHARYCDLTGGRDADAARVRIRETTKMLADDGPTEQELESWDREAETIMATATDAEVKAAQERLGLTATSGRVLALMVDYCRRHPRRR